MTTKMPKDNWMRFIDSVWTALTYRQWLKQYEEAGDRIPQVPFFGTAAFAVRNELLMGISRIVHLCKEIGKNFDIGATAQAVLKDIESLYAKGEISDDRMALVFEDCGVKLFRDKLLAHPLNEIKATLGKPNYQISLKWKTVEETLGKINKFCDAVEDYYRNEWEMTTYRGEQVGDDSRCSYIVHLFEQAETWDRLKDEIAKKGRPRVHWDWNADTLVIEDE